MNTKTKLIAYGAIVSIVTVAFGFWSEPGGSTDTIKLISDHMNETPGQLASWEVNSTGEVDSQQADVLQCTNSFIRTYVGSKSGERIVAAVMLGKAGPISLHDPNVCYPMAGYTEEGNKRRERFKVGDKEIALWTTVLKKGDVGGERIKVAWGWNAGKGWDAPDNARFHYAGEPYLIKVQIVQELQNRSAEEDKGIARFVEEFMPSLDRQLNIRDEAPKA